MSKISRLNLHSAIVILFCSSFGIISAKATAQNKPLRPLGQISVPHNSQSCPDELQARVVFRKNPKDWIPRSNLGRALLYRNKLNEAIELHLTAIANNPRERQAYSDLADALVLKNQLDEAVITLRKSLTISGQYSAAEIEAMAYSSVGDRLVSLNRLETAVAFYQKSLLPKITTANDIINASRRAAPYRKLGMMLARYNRQKEAFSAFHKAVDIDPLQGKTSPTELEEQTYQELGNAFRQQANLEAAESAYKGALALNPNNVETHIRLAETYLGLNQPEASLSAYRKVLQLLPNNIYVKLRVADVLVQQNQLDQALSLFRQVVASHPQGHEATAYNGIGIVLMRQNQPTAAIAAWRKAAELNPRYLEALEHLGDALIKQNQLKAALSAYQPYLNSQKSAEAYYNFGNFLSKYGFLASEAAEAYMKAIALDSSFSSAYPGLIKALNIRNRAQQGSSRP